MAYGFAVFALYLFIVPAVQSMAAGVSYSDAWDSAYGPDLLAGIVVTIAVETIGLFRSKNDANHH